MTPDALAEAICARLYRETKPIVVIEPSAGSGPFVRAARTRWRSAQIIAVEINPSTIPVLGRSGADAVVVQDWVEYAARLRGPRSTPGRRLIVGSPPPRQAQRHIEAALGIMRPGDVLAFVLRLSLLGSAVRVGLSELWPITPSPGAEDFGVFVWRVGRRGPARVGAPIEWQSADAPVADASPPGASGSPRGAGKPGGTGAKRRVGASTRVSTGLPPPGRRVQAPVQPGATG